jgi:hypothetical protein
MFPPVRTENLREALKGLWESLQRVENYFTGNGSVSEVGKNKYRVDMHLHALPPKPVRAPMRSYVKAYAKECGWTASSVMFADKVMILHLKPRK